MIMQGGASSFSGWLNATVGSRPIEVRLVDGDNSLWPTVGAALLGGVLSLSGAYLASWHAAKSTRDDRREAQAASELNGKRERLGRAYALIGAFLTHTNAVMNAAKLGNRELFHELMRDESAAAPNFDWIIQIDAPAALPELVALSKAEDDCNAFIGALLEMNVGERRQDEVFETGNAVGAALAESCDDLCRALVREFNKLAPSQEVAHQADTK